MAEQSNPQNQEELGVWVREQFQKANKHLAENGILFKSVTVEKCRYLAPICAVWQIATNDKKDYWVISGDVPSDYMALDGAGSARDAIRHFSFKWQMQAENIRRQVVDDQVQLNYAQILEQKAERLYQVFADDTLWQTNG